MKLIRFITSSTGSGRRGAMELLKSGRVKIGGKTADDSTIQVNPDRDNVTIDGKPVKPRRDIYLLMYKPRKTICTTRDPEGRITVSNFLSHRHKRAVSVGRLDYNTTGVLLLMTDGELANALLKSRKVKRNYVVKLKCRATERNFDRWRKGLVIDGRKTSGASVRIIERRENITKITVTITEGWYHLIHRMAEKTGMRVLKIHRTQFAEISLGALKPGTYRLLTKKEVKLLKKQVAPAQQRSAVGPVRPAGQKRRGPRESRNRSRRTGFCGCK